FGLHPPPERPHPSYSRLSRYDATGLCWLLQGRRVAALTADTAAIENPATGNLTTYRKHNKPALGPLGDSLASRSEVTAMNPKSPARGGSLRQWEAVGMSRAAWYRLFAHISVHRLAARRSPLSWPHISPMTRCLIGLILAPLLSGRPVVL